MSWFWSWLSQPLQRLLGNHGFLFLLWLRRDFKSRYAGSIAGLLWALLQPLFTIAIFYVVFALVLRVRIPEFANESGYFFYLLAGLLPWLSIADGIARASGALVAQEQFLQRIVFPIDILPVTVIVSSLAAQLVGTVIYIVMLWFAGLLEPWRLLFWPLILLLQLGLCSRYRLLTRYYQHPCKRCCTNCAGSVAVIILCCPYSLS